MTPQDLKAFRDRVPDCELAVYADLASQTVLTSDGTLQYPQEYLDAVCTSAVQIFDAMPDDEGTSVDHVIFLAPTGGRGFVRDMSEPDEVLCCIFAPQTDCRHFIREAREALRKNGARE